MNYILVADNQEAENIHIPQDIKNETEIIVLGYGGPASLRTLSDLLLNGKFTNNDRFFNVGYVGSNEFPVGTVVSVAESYREFPSIKFEEKVYKLDAKSNVKNAYFFPYSCGLQNKAQNLHFLCEPPH